MEGMGSIVGCRGTEENRPWLRMGPGNFQKQVSYFLVVYTHGRGI